MLRKVGRRLREERLRLMLDQASFGELAGVSKNSQYAYESGKTSPTIDYLLYLADHGVDIVYVLSGTRRNGTLGAEETWLVEMFRDLPLTQRDALVRLLMAFTGREIAASEIGAKGEGV